MSEQIETASAPPEVSPASVRQLRFVHGFGCRRIARELGLPLRTVREWCGEVRSDG